MSDPIKIEATSWPYIRFTLVQREDGLFQFIEQHRRSDEPDLWDDNYASGLCGSAADAQRDLASFIADYEET